MENKHYIYGLKDPCTNEVKYVGATVNPESRLKSHLLLPHSPKIKEWIDQLSILGQKPIMIIIEETNSEKAQDLERHWISEYRALGCLLNSTVLASRNAPSKIKGSTASIKISKDILMSAGKIKDETGVPIGAQFELAWTALYGTTDQIKSK